MVHNGIVTNYKDIKKFLEKRGYKFESETDTEIIAKLIHHLYEQHPQYSFRELVEQVIQQLEGAFALAFKSVHFPGECVATRRGSPLLVGIKTKTRLATDHIPILYGKGIITECIKSNYRVLFFYYINSIHKLFEFNGIAISARMYHTPNNLFDDLLNYFRNFKRND